MDSAVVSSWLQEISALSICSSGARLILARKLGNSGEEIDDTMAAGEDINLLGSSRHSILHRSRSCYLLTKVGES